MPPAEAVEAGIETALAQGEITAFVADYLMAALTPVLENLEWIESHPGDPNMNTMVGQTCTLINSFNSRVERMYRDRRLSKAYRDEWKGEMLEVKADIGCKW